jgi:phospholipid/cholesterol/gamma-HCH transport system substrate-binding protein
MGDVTAVELRAEDVLVTLRLDREVTLTDEARFLVGTQGLVGERFVEVDPGRGQPVRDLAQRVFDGRHQPAATEMVGQLDLLNAKLLSFLERADRLLADVEAAGGLGETVAQTTRAARSAADMLERGADGFVSASESLGKAGKRIEGFLDEHGDDLDAGAQGFARAAGQLDSLTTQLTAVADGAEDVVAALREQEGTLGKLIYDEEMSENVAKSIETLRFILEDIKRNPQRYLTVKVF